MKTLWLVRHARPLIEPGRCYGRLDIRADAEASMQAAQALHRALQPWRGDLSLWHSPLQRCKQLTLDLQELEPDFMARPDARLQEMDFGRWEGLRWDEIGASAVDDWARNLALHAPGGGESLAQMLARVAQALDDARSCNSSQVVWICHAGVARCAQWLLLHGLQLPQSQEWTLAAPAYGQWLQLQLD